MSGNRKIGATKVRYIKVILDYPSIHRGENVIDRNHIFLRQFLLNGKTSLGLYQGIQYIEVLINYYVISVKYKWRNTV